MRETVTLITEIFIGISCMVVAILGWVKAEELIADSRQKQEFAEFKEDYFSQKRSLGANAQQEAEYLVPRLRACTTVSEKYGCSRCDACEYKDCCNGAISNARAAARLLADTYGIAGEE